MNLSHIFFVLLFFGNCLCVTYTWQQSLNPGTNLNWSDLYWNPSTPTPTSSDSFILNATNSVTITGNNVIANTITFMGPNNVILNVNLVNSDVNSLVVKGMNVSATVNTLQSFIQRIDVSNGKLVLDNVNNLTVSDMILTVVGKLWISEPVSVNSMFVMSGTAAVLGSELSLISGNATLSTSYTQCPSDASIIKNYIELNIATLVSNFYICNWINYGITRFNRSFDFNMRGTFENFGTFSAFSDVALLTEPTNFPGNFITASHSRITFGKSYNFTGNCTGNFDLVNTAFTIKTKNFRNFNAKGSVVTIETIDEDTWTYDSIVLYDFAVLVIESYSRILINTNLTILNFSALTIKGSVTVNNFFKWDGMSNIDGNGIINLGSNCLSLWTTSGLLNATINNYGEINYEPSISHYIGNHSILMNYNIFNLKNSENIWSLGRFYNNKTFTIDLPVDQTLKIIGEFINDGKTIITSGSFLVPNFNYLTTFHHGIFQYSEISSIEFYGNHNFLANSVIESLTSDYSNLTFSNGNFELSITPIPPTYHHGNNANVNFLINVQLSNLIVSSGSLSFNQESSTIDNLNLMGNGILLLKILGGLILNNFQCSDQAQIIGQNAEQKLVTNENVMIYSSVPIANIHLINIGFMKIFVDNYIFPANSIFSNEGNLNFLNGNLTMASSGSHTGNFQFNSENSSIILDSSNINFLMESNIVASKIVNKGQTTILGQSSINSLFVESGNLTIVPVYTSDGKLLVTGGTVTFNNFTQLNSINLESNGKVNFFKDSCVNNISLIATSNSITLSNESSLTVRSILTIDNNAQINGNGKLIIKDSCTLTFSRATLNAELHNLGVTNNTLTGNSILNVNNKFINYPSGTLILNSITINGNGNLMNYGIFQSYNESLIVLNTEFINFGNVVMTTSNFTLSKNFTQYNGNTDIRNLNAKNIELYGGSFHSNSKIYVLNGFNHYGGNIAVGYNNEISSLLIQGNAYNQFPNATILFDIGTSCDILTVTALSFSFQGRFEIIENDNITLPMICNIIDYGVSATGRFAPIIYSKKHLVTLDVTSNNMYQANITESLPLFYCDKCINGYCLNQGVCQCFEGYTGVNCNEYECSEGCGNGNCIGPNICNCSNNWNGYSCDLFLVDCILAFGCTDPIALNYNPVATINDNSCVYSNDNNNSSGSVTSSESGATMTTATISTTYDTSSSSTTGAMTTGSQADLTIKSSSQSGSSGAVIGGIIGGILGFLCILATIILLVLRKKRQHKNKDKDPENSSNLELVPNGNDRNSVVMGTGADKYKLKNIVVMERLGGGNYGEVFRGLWKKITPVALKKLKNEQQLQEFAKEADMLHELRHQNIVQFFGIYIDEATKEQYMVTEFMAKGSLSQLLLSEEKSSITIADLIKMSLDCAIGMSYLHEKNIIHCDLALRNLLVSTESQKYLVKVADFGMSKTITNSGLYSRVNENETLPIKWTAIEVLEFGKYSFASDVWSFGVVLYELFSWGKMPYVGWSNKETIENLKQGERLEKPNDCPVEIYQIMLNCWNLNPAARPTMEELCENINNILGKFSLGKLNENNNNVTNIPLNGGNYGNEPLYNS